MISLSCSLLLRLVLVFVRFLSYSLFYQNARSPLFFSSRLYLLQRVSFEQPRFLLFVNPVTMIWENYILDNTTDIILLHFFSLPQKLLPLVLSFFSLPAPSSPETILSRQRYGVDAGTLYSRAATVSPLEHIPRDASP